MAKILVTGLLWFLVVIPMIFIQGFCRSEPILSLAWIIYGSVPSVVVALILYFWSARGFFKSSNGLLVLISIFYVCAVLWKNYQWHKATQSYNEHKPNLTMLASNVIAYYRIHPEKFTIKSPSLEEISIEGFADFCEKKPDCMSLGFKNVQGELANVNGRPLKYAQDLNHNGEIGGSWGRYELGWNTWQEILSTGQAHKVLIFSVRSHFECDLPSDTCTVSPYWHLPSNDTARDSTCSASGAAYAWINNVN